MNACTKEIVVYAYAKVETLVQSLSESTHCSEDELTDGLVTLLRSKGTWLTDSVPALSGHSTKNGNAVAEVAVDVSSHSKPRRQTVRRSMSASAKKRISLAQKARWAAWHKQQKKAA
jgi:hypothetical protein